MTIPFSSIPSAQRVPFVAVEIDPSRAIQGTPQVPHRVLVIGQKVAAGVAAANALTRIGVADEGVVAYGEGSMLSEMFRAIKAADRYTDTYGLALADDVAGVAAVGDIVFGGPATAAGAIAGLIAGQAVKIAVTSGQTAAQVATAFAAAVNALTRLPVTAAVDGVDTAKVNLTCKWKGLTGNDIDIRFNYYAGESLPAGITATITAMATGATNPDISAAITAMASEQWHAIIFAYTDSANLVDLEAELASRWLPTRQIDGQAFTAYRGTHGATGTFGDTRNSFLVSCIGTNIVPDPPWAWAAVYGIVSAAALAIDPARQLKTLPLVGLKPPAMGVTWDGPERNLLLYDGISTYTVDAGGICRIDRAITMNQTNANGITDEAYLDVTTPATVSYLRFSLINRIAGKYGRHKLADDGTQFGEGQAIVTPNILTAEQLVLFLEWQEAGLVEDLDQYRRDLYVERDPDNRNRVNALVPPNIINNFMQFAALLQFRL